MESSILEELKSKAGRLYKRIALIAGDSRVSEALSIITENRIAIPVLVGKKSEIENQLSGKQLREIEIADTAELKEQFIARYENCIKNIEDCSENPVYIAAMLVETGAVAGAVAGADSPTAEVARAALKIIGTVKNSPMSGAFLMISDDKKLGYDGAFVFSDCAVIPRPDSYQLACIATDAANLARMLGIEPVVAMLSYSTNLSARGKEVERVREALKFLKTADFAVDGEMQLDAAIVKEVGKRKYPESEVAGRATVLIFPDLNSGNIGYKLVERIGKMKAIGPIFLGIKKPFNDLSRGCEAGDIVNSVALTSLMCSC